MGRSTFLAATLAALATGPRSATEVAGEIRAASGATSNYFERLGDAVRKDEAGRYRLADETFGLWLQWRQPGGTVVPMKVVGDEEERIVAAALAAMGFDLVYQSRASRGHFDLLGTRGSCQWGIQVKASPPPLRFDPCLVSNPARARRRTLSQLTARDPLSWHDGHDPRFVSFSSSWWKAIYAGCDSNIPPASCSLAAVELFQPE